VSENRSIWDKVSFSETLKLSRRLADTQLRGFRRNIRPANAYGTEGAIQIVIGIKAQFK